MTVFRAYMTPGYSEKRRDTDTNELLPQAEIGKRGKAR